MSCGMRASETNRVAARSAPGRRATISDSWMAVYADLFLLAVELGLAQRTLGAGPTAGAPCGCPESNPPEIHSETLDAETGENLVWNNERGGQNWERLQVLLPIRAEFHARRTS